MLLTWDDVTKTNCCHCNKTEIKCIKKGDVLVNADEISTKTKKFHQNQGRFNSISRKGVVVNCPPKVKTAFSTPESNDTKLKKIDFS